MSARLTQTYYAPIEPLLPPQLTLLRIDINNKIDFFYNTSSFHQNEAYTNHNLYLHDYS